MPDDSVPSHDNPWPLPLCSGTHHLCHLSDSLEQEEPFWRNEPSCMGFVNPWCPKNPEGKKSLHVYSNTVTEKLVLVVQAAKSIPEGLSECWVCVNSSTGSHPSVLPELPMAVRVQYLDTYETLIPLSSLGFSLTLLRPFNTVPRVVVTPTIKLLIPTLYL